MSVAGVAHLVERHLAKVEVASSSLVARSIEQIRKYLLFFARFPRLEGWNLTVRWTDNLRPFRREFKRRTRGAPLPMEEILLKWYHLNTLILKIFSDY